MKTNTEDKATARPFNPRTGSTFAACLTGNGVPFLMGATQAFHKCGCHVVGNGTLPHPLDFKLCDKHQQAMGEHAALVAVAEAAKYVKAALEPVPDIQLKDGCICAGCGAWTPKGHPEAHDHTINCPEVRRRSALFGQRSHNERHGKRMLDEALAALATIREGKAVPS